MLNAIFFDMFDKNALRSMWLEVYDLRSSNCSPGLINNLQIKGYFKTK